MGKSKRSSHDVDTSNAASNSKEIESIRDIELFRRILSHSPDIILITDEKGIILFINQVVDELRFKEVVGESIYSYIDEDSHSIAKDAIAQSIKSGKTQEYKIKGLGSNPNKLSTYKTRVTPLRNQDDKLELLFTSTDISDLEDMEKTSQILKSQLLHTDRLANLGILAAGIGHEINNPLAIALGHLNKIRAYLAKQDKKIYSGINDRVEKLESAIVRISNIVKGLNYFSKPERVHGNQSFDLKDSTLETLKFIQEMFDRQGVKIDLDCKADDLKVQGCSEQFQQVLLNLITNATDAVKEVKNPKILIEIGKKEEEVYLKISDNGCGIYSDQINRIFEAFFTTKSRDKGTGLGLSISKNIIESMNGDIKVSSQPKNGTEFTVFLPTYRSF